MEFSTEFDARIGQGDVTLSARDVTLLRAIDEHGSINAAATALERSYSRSQQRIVELEDVFGSLVTRKRGGSGGGGSRLTDDARTLLARYDRLRAEFSGVAETAETVLDGTVVDREGELATVETAAGTLRALVPESGAMDEIRLTVRADAVTLQSASDSAESERTSARNRLEGTVSAVDAGESVALVDVDLGSVTLSALVTDASVETLNLSPGTSVVASFKATATRGVPVGK